MKTLVLKILALWTCFVWMSLAVDSDWSAWLVGGLAVATLTLGASIIRQVARLEEEAPWDS